jgi:hypothetical protein
MDLKENHAALILDIDGNGEITVDVSSQDINGLAGKLCVAIAKKLLNDENFQAELMEMISENEDDDGAE